MVVATDSRCMLGLFSPESGAKPEKPATTKPRHVTMKCGWICLDCRTTEFKFPNLMEKTCRGKFKHRKVLNAAYMCQNCPAICDDLAMFKTEVCACRLDVEGPPVAASPSPGSSEKGAGLSMKRREGRIGGTFMEVPVHERAGRCPVGEAAEAKARAPTPAAPRPSCRSDVKDLTFFPVAKPDSASPDRTPCPKPDKLETALKPKQAEPTTEVTSAPATVPGGRDNVRSKIVEAEQELQKLLLLKALQAERQKLEKLLMQKAEEARQPSRSLGS